MVDGSLVVRAFAGRWLAWWTTFLAIAGGSIVDDRTRSARSWSFAAA